jgi:hypothetical protein
LYDHAAISFSLARGSAVGKGVDWGLAEAATALMRPPLIVVGEQGVKIGLQLFDGPIDLFAEPTKLVEQRALETLAEPVPPRDGVRLVAELPQHPRALHRPFASDEEPVSYHQIHPGTAIRNMRITG